MNVSNGEKTELENHVNGNVDFTQFSDFSHIYEKTCSKKEEIDGSHYQQTHSHGPVVGPIEPDVSITMEDIRGVSHVKPAIVKPALEILPIKNSSDKNHVASGRIRKKMNLKFRRERRQFLNRRKLEKCKNAGIKFKCFKCSVSEFLSQEELTTHQLKCTGPPSTKSESSTSQTSPKTTRKVYLCSACGTYFENWNLFLHMKEMHKRHICLYCLGMFSQPDKLAQHLQTKHNVVEQTLTSIQAFYNAYRGPCYLVCCGCEKLFTEEDVFHEHFCPSNGRSVDASTCPHCGLQGAQGAHYPNCRRSRKSAFNSYPSKKPKKKSNKRKRDIFKVVNNDSPSELSVTVRKQLETDVDNCLDNADAGHLTEESSIRQYNEKMLQLYRPSKPPDRITSSIQSIEESINRVVRYSTDLENSNKHHGGDVMEGETSRPPDVALPVEEDEEEEDTNMPTPEKQPPVEDELKSEETKTEDPAVTEPSHSLLEKPQEVKEELPGVTKALDQSFLNDASDNDSSDSEKLTIALEPNPDKTENEDEFVKPAEEVISTAGPEAAYLHVAVEGIDITCIRAVLKECVKMSCWNCVYCAHAKRIAVNGKQLILHVLSEHRFVLGPEDMSDEDKASSVSRLAEQLKNNISCMESTYFNSDTFDSEDKLLWKPTDRIYECHHCLFATYIHKELCSHNRKMHQKNVFLCIMCKLSFYSYSELLCHLCPGIYIPGQVINPDVTYRCYACDASPLPSAFRLMVHLRKVHNACDICFDVTATQLQLSTHVWKHKQSHMCYRCGIAYRNKPDITKHLFWKHGTESVLCKRCLQKKWPHVYHFCVPPTSFLCDECTISLKSAVALKVHKRLHAGQFPYSCDRCEDKFISRKLLNRHKVRHEEEEKKALEEPLSKEEGEEKMEVEQTGAKEGDEDNPGEADATKEETDQTPTKAVKKSRKKKELSDLFDLPPVNLSESDDSDQEETPILPPIVRPPTPPTEPLDPAVSNEADKEDAAPQVVDGVWDNFKNFLERSGGRTLPSPFQKMSLARMKMIMVADHDYCLPGGEGQASLDHDYCDNKQEATPAESKEQEKEKEKTKSRMSTSESSSDSDSSCSCGSNCSCSSNSSSSSSSDSGSGSSHERRKERKKIPKKKKPVNEVLQEPIMEIEVAVPDGPSENLINESDLDTDETVTDEEFYDYNPAREASRILAEKRTQLLANLNGEGPPLIIDEPQPTKRKMKTKKKRSQARSRNTGVKVARKKPIVPQNGDLARHQSVVHSRLLEEEPMHSSGESDGRRPKRKRVPLKYYGFSSEDESDVSQPKKKERLEHNSTTPAPPPAAAEGPIIWKPPPTTWRLPNETLQPKIETIKIRTSQPGTEPFLVRKPTPPTLQINGGGPDGQKNEKLYCFCQCPYDEVSEMIACDARDCAIEWFHFECVGIMVPPKGSWYCPDCKKKFAAENEFMVEQS